MNYRIIFFIASVLLMHPLSVMADNSLESAEKAYNEGKFAEAAAIYGKISQEHGQQRQSAKETDFTQQYFRAEYIQCNATTEQDRSV